MTKYEIVVRLLAEYAICPTDGYGKKEIPEEWCAEHCGSKGDPEEEIAKCWEKVINDRYEAQNEEDKKEPREDVISRQAAIDAIYEHEFSNWCDKDEVSTILNDLPSVACNCSEPPNGSECEDAVSRQAVIDALERIFDRCEEIEAHLPEGDPDRTGYKMFPDYMTVWKYLHQLPSALMRGGKTMCDLISRQAAIDALDKRFDSIPTEQTTEILLLRRDLRNLPSAQPESCEDVVSREAVLKIIDDYNFKYPQYMEHFVSELRDAMKEDLKDDVRDLPSVTPKNAKCDDAVSRSEAIIQLSHNKIGDDDCDAVIQRDIETIKRLPSVTLKIPECEAQADEDGCEMMLEVAFDNPGPTIEVVEYDNELSMPMTEAVRKMGGMKGLFIPGITAEEFKNGSLEAVEDLISSGEVYDVTLRNTSVQPEQRWIPCEERLPEEDYWLGGSGKQFSDSVLVSIVNNDDDDEWICISHTIDGEWALGLPKHCKILAWAPLPEPYKEEKK